MNRGEKMARVRAQAKLVARLAEQMKEMAADGLRSPRLPSAALFGMFLYSKIKSDSFTMFILHPFSLY
ncbi:MAG: hypothetical protein IJO53_02035, partial [Clostridia bacterium]|nr:hypothetical protein [Clostridia bacterium]